MITMRLLWLIERGYKNLLVFQRCMQLLYLRIHTIITRIGMVRMLLVGANCLHDNVLIV